MLRCPSCGGALTRAPTPFGVIEHCPACAGRLVGLATLRRDRVATAFRGRLWFESEHARLGERRCPHCAQAMRLVEVPAGTGRVELDVCRHCQTVWFDRAEYARVPHAAAAPAGPPVARLLSDPRAREAAALLDLRTAQARAEAADDGGPVAPWKYLPAIFGMPVEISAPPLAARPLATWGLGAALVAVFVLTWSNLQAAVNEHGFIPDQWARAGGLTAASSFFIHGGLLHLASNLYFLLVFGDNVEDRLGRGRFLLLVLLAHLAGVGLHAGLEPRGAVPLVGASAGISGIVAFYALTFPRTRLGLLFFYVFWLRLPAWTMLVLYTLAQLLGAAMQAGGFGDVSNLGHLGGLGVGAAAALLAHAHSGGGARSEPGPGYNRSERG